MVTHQQPNSRALDSEAIGRLTEAESADLSAAIKDSFYEARDQGRTMHQAAEDRRIGTAVETIVRAHVTAALAEVESRIEAAALAADLDYIQVGKAHVRRHPYAPEHYREAAALVRDYREGVGR